MMNRLKIELLPIEEDGYHIFLDAVINGEVARLLIDTGASRTVFDEERIKAFLSLENHSFEKIDKLSAGLGTNTMESHSVILEEFRLGETIFKEYQAVVLNMEHVNHSYRMLGQKPIDGVLGGDLLQKLKVVVDYRKKEVRWRMKPVKCEE
ncbi:MAG: retroviral-like aspartic protease family protein [Bacteroidales bacterium]|nr:retroviral-like aspartic protease family protein [Bacteroidales bacterium]